MATLLEQYREKIQTVQKQVAEGDLPVDKLLPAEELIYRACVLDAFQMFSRVAPKTDNPKEICFHYQLVDRYIGFIMEERRFGLKTDEAGQKRRKTSLQSLEQVVQDGRKRFSSFKCTGKDQYREAINKHINTILPVWLQYREAYIPLSGGNSK